MKSYYTKEVLEKAVKESLSIFQVIKKLNLRISGGTHTTVKFWIKKHQLDTKHFLGQGHALGKKSNKRLNCIDVLVYNRCSGRKEKVDVLRRAMIESGIKHECHECNNTIIWNNKPLCLQIHHIDGDNINNRKENLCFLCPNCHSQTENFGVKNI